MSPPKTVEKMSTEEMRAELVSLLSDGVLRYLAKRKVDGAIVLAFRTTYASNNER